MFDLRILAAADRLLSGAPAPAPAEAGHRAPWTGAGRSLPGSPGRPERSCPFAGSRAAFPQAEATA